MDPGTLRLDEGNARSSSLLPRSVAARALAVLDRVALRLVAVGVTANAVTLASLGLAAVAAVLVGAGLLGWATPLLALASVGDALDGLVARRSGEASIGGALLDASVDRYEELLVMGGIAVLFRDSLPALVVTLLALGGSFMVSYGSAKAEAIGRAVPPGVMRRAERAMIVCAGVGATPLFALLARARGLSAWAGYAPLLAAVLVIGVVGNVSAILRLRRLAAG
jgi:CDP-diacylglycerol--glycerol-3-phosphate 3-phosphatidyltransferase